MPAVGPRHGFLEGYSSPVWQLFAFQRNVSSVPTAFSMFMRPAGARNRECQVRKGPTRNEEHISLRYSSLLLVRTFHQHNTSCDQGLQGKKRTLLHGSL